MCVTFRLLRMRERIDRTDQESDRWTERTHVQSSDQDLIDQSSVKKRVNFEDRAPNKI